jgi:hypothetical protein
VETREKDIAVALREKGREDVNYPAATYTAGSHEHGDEFNQLNIRCQRRSYATEFISVKFSHDIRPCHSSGNRRLSTAAARVLSQVRSWGICGGQSGTGAGFLQVLGFPLPILIPPTASHSSSIIRGWYNKPNIGRRTKWTQSHPTPRNLKKNWS